MEVMAKYMNYMDNKDFSNVWESVKLIGCSIKLPLLSVDENPEFSLEEFIAELVEKYPIVDCKVIKSLIIYDDVDKIHDMYPMLDIHYIRHLQSSISLALKKMSFEINQYVQHVYSVRRKMPNDIFFKNNRQVADTLTSTYRGNFSCKVYDVSSKTTYYKD
jgi:hypothetical protein